MTLDANHQAARDRQLQGAIVFTFVAHGAAMLGMLIFLLPMVPGGGGAGGDLDRVLRIAASPLSYRLGWLGWQITAVSDIVLAGALLRATPVGAARRWAIAQLVLIGLAIVPDQSAQFLLVTRGVEIAQRCAVDHDPAAFLHFENTVFPLTTGWGALLYTLAAIAWAGALRLGGRWNRVLEYLTPPMLVLFLLISIGPLLPLAIRPRGEVIGAGNAFAFTLLEGWFIGVFFASRQKLAKRG